MADVFNTSGRVKKSQSHEQCDTFGSSSRVADVCNTGGRVKNVYHTEITGVGDINLVTPTPMHTDKNVLSTAPSVCRATALKCDDDDISEGKKRNTDEGICVIKRGPNTVVIHGCDVKSFDVTSKK